MHIFFHMYVADFGEHFKLRWCWSLRSVQWEDPDSPLGHAAEWVSLSPFRFPAAFLKIFRSNFRSCSSCLYEHVLEFRLKSRCGGNRSISIAKSTLLDYRPAVDNDYLWTPPTEQVIYVISTPSSHWNSTVLIQTKHYWPLNLCTRVYRQTK